MDRRMRATCIIWTSLFVFSCSIGNAQTSNQVEQHLFAGYQRQTLAELGALTLMRQNKTDAAIEMLETSIDEAVDRFDRLSVSCSNAQRRHLLAIVGMIKAYRNTYPRTQIERTNNTPDELKRQAMIHRVQERLRTLDDGFELDMRLVRGTNAANVKVAGPAIFDYSSGRFAVDRAMLLRDWSLAETNLITLIGLLGADCDDQRQKAESDLEEVRRRLHGNVAK